VPKKYRKKPVIVEAVQVNFGYTNVLEIKAFVGESFVDMFNGKVPYIKTLEGDMYISDGDYIIKGVQGEFYPCKPDIFEATYEPANALKDATITISTNVNIDEIVNKLSQRLVKELEKLHQQQ
jgi:hypothetical protein